MMTFKPFPPSSPQPWRRPFVEHLKFVFKLKRSIFFQWMNSRVKLLKAQSFNHNQFNLRRDSKIIQCESVVLIFLIRWEVWFSGTVAIILRDPDLTAPSESFPLLSRNVQKPISGLFRSSESEAIASMDNLLETWTVRRKDVILFLLYTTKNPNRTSDNHGNNGCSVWNYGREATQKTCRENTRLCFNHSRKASSPGFEDRRDNRG